MKSTWWKSLGPGLMWAGAAIGVSHLVQSTRAGAMFGFDLVWVVVLANLLKYPFFEFAPRYAAATGESLIDGYERTGRWAIWMYGVFTLLTMFTIQAAVTMVTAGILKNVAGWEMNIVATAVILLVFTALLIITGKYVLLDKVVKWIVILLTVTTVFAVLVAWWKSGEKVAHGPDFDWGNAGNLAFLIALAGWMPAPIDVSVWHSLWSVEKRKTLEKGGPWKYALLDFKIGYYGTAVLALFFLALGALVMYGSGEKFSSKAAVFAHQLIKMYTQVTGEWAYPLIAFAALATMFSTTVTCMDAYLRVLPATSIKIFPSLRRMKPVILNNVWLVILLAGTILLISNFMHAMKSMVDLATTLSFVTAPVMAFLNYKAVTSDHFPRAYKPGGFLRRFAWVSMVFLALFSLGYLAWRFGW